MESSIYRVLANSELTEYILSKLDCSVEIVRVQRVCRNWRDLIQSSPILREACWYRCREPDRQSAGQQIYKLNPVFNQFGVQLSLPSDRIQEVAEFTLEKRIYDKPGSWTTMLATQPPGQWIEVGYYSEFSSSDTISYLIESMTGFLLMGDVMAVLAECQNRQVRDVDRFARVEHHIGRFSPVTEEELHNKENRRHHHNWHGILKEMANDVLVKVAIAEALTLRRFPAFSLRRVYPHAEPNENTAGRAYLLHESRSSFLHELIVHRMYHNGKEYSWDRRLGCFDNCILGKYEANLVAVKEHPVGYLARYTHTLPLLSDV